MSDLATAVRWDWFKLMRRWMPWILLVILLLISQLGVWGNYIRYQNLKDTGGTLLVGAETGRGRHEVSCRDVLAGRTTGLPAGTSTQVVQGLQAECGQLATQNAQQLSNRLDGFTLPGSIPTALDFGVSIAVILLAILTASVFGSEYGWGTVRPALVRGIGRWRYLAAKLILLALLSAAALLVVVAATAISSIAADWIAGSPARVGGTTWDHAAVVVAKSWVALLPYMVFAAFITVLTRSSASGMAIAISYYPGEQIIVGILSGLFGWFSSVARYLLAQNLGAWAGLTGFGQDQTSVSAPHALLVLLAYTLVLGGVAFYVFEVRDVTGANAG